MALLGICFLAGCDLGPELEHLPDRVGPQRRAWLDEQARVQQEVEKIDLALKKPKLDAGSREHLLEQRELARSRAQRVQSALDGLGGSAEKSTAGHH